VLGSIGLGLLVYTVISLMQKIERAFNFIWHVSHQRPFAQRFSGYLSVIVIGPVLVFSSLGITASLTSTSVVVALTSIEPFGSLIRFAGTVLPYVLVVGAFTFIYMFMPNTRVRVSAALVGAAVAGLLWNTAGWAFTSFVASSTQYTAIYSAFAALIIFMIWLYMSWLILLIGADIAFYYQHPEYLMPQRGELQLSSRYRERLVLAAAAAIAADFYRGHRAPGTDDIAHRLRIPATAVERVLAPLAESGLLTRSGDDPPGWLPARPPETVSVKTLLDLVRAEGESAATGIGQSPANAAIDDAMARLDAAIDDAFEGWTLKQLAQAGGEPGGEPAGVDAAPDAAPQRIRAER
jgi:membrane protein